MLQFCASSLFLLWLQINVNCVAATSNCKVLFHAATSECEVTIDQNNLPELLYISLQTN